MYGTFSCHATMADLIIQCYPETAVVSRGACAYPCIAEYTRPDSISPPPFPLPVLIYKTILGFDPHLFTQAQTTDSSSHPKQNTFRQTHHRLLSLIVNIQISRLNLFVSTFFTGCQADRKHTMPYKRTLAATGCEEIGKAAHPPGAKRVRSALTVVRAVAAKRSAYMAYKRVLAGIASQYYIVTFRRGVPERATCDTY